MSYVTVVRCKLGHRFARLDDHPFYRDEPLCPHCAHKALEESERCKDRMLIAVLDTPEPPPAAIASVLHKALRRAHAARFS